MNRLSLYSWSLSLLALGVGLAGYSASAAGEKRSDARLTQAGAERDRPAPGQQRFRPADTTIWLESDESLTAALRRAGVAAFDAATADQAAADLRPQVGRPVRLWLGEAVGMETRTLMRLEFRTAGGERMALTRNGEAFELAQMVDPVDETPVRLRLDGTSGLGAELVAAGLSRAVRDEVVDAVGSAQAAAVDLIIAHEESPSGATYGAPLYLGLHLRDGRVKRWIGEGTDLRPIEAGQGGAVGAGLLRPIPGPITSNPGLRLHPILRYLRWHRGTDFAAPTGMPVQAALAGRVVEAGWRGGYGRVVRLAHSDGSETLYAHLSDIDVVAGEMIPQGAVVGAVGASGLATGPHLHFEWAQGGQTLKPRFAAALPRGLVLNDGQRAKLQKILTSPFRLPPRRQG